MAGTVLGAGDMAVDKTRFQSRAQRILRKLWAIDELVNCKLHLSVFGPFPRGTVMPVSLGLSFGVDQVIRGDAIKLLHEG